MQRPAPNGTLFATPLRTLAAVSLVAASVALPAGSARAQTSTLPSTDTMAVPTYEAVGLYWLNPGGTAGCEVKYRKWGESAWIPGLAMWYDARDNQCRGSVVALAPNTSYQVEFNLPGQAATRGLVFKTWSNQVPVAKTITVGSGSGTYNIAEGGSPSGYVVYDGGGATLDGQNGAQYNITINASYVIVRGLVLKGAKQDAIRISPNVKDVIIEDNDISGWGRTRDGTWGTDMDSAIRAVCSSPTLERVTIQRNRIRDPRYSANSWSDGHPAGPQAVAFSHCGGNHVIRHNEVFSTNGNYFNDIIGGEDNFTKAGFPNADTDIYGNRLSNAWDDGIEAEGANENVRIWGNYIDRTAIGIATTATSVGPVYIFRNVWNRAQMYQKISSLDADQRQPLFKSGGTDTLGHGRRYVFHNTMLQARQPGLLYGLGGGFGMGGTGSTQLNHNTVSSNNIYHMWKDGKGAMYQTGSSSQFANDLYNGTPGDATMMANGISGTPVYQSGHGWQSEAGGNYQLASTSPGYGKGARVPNFNDGVAAPDVGAHQSGTASMQFGIAASPGSAVGGSGSTATSGSSSPTPTAGTGTASTTSGMDSSAYTAPLGRAVTFTASVSGNSGTPTGTVDFRADGATITGCGAVALSSGKASCTTSSLPAGSLAIRGLYSGDATYTTGTAGPITQTITASITTSADLALVQSATPNPAMVRKELLFTFVVSNNGAGTATSVVLTDKLPSSVKFLWASPGCAEASGIVTCKVPSIASGAGVELKVAVQPGKHGTLTNSGSVEAAEPDPDTANNTSTASVAVQKEPATK